MAVNWGFYQTLAIGVAGFVPFCAAELFLRPRPRLARPKAAWLAQMGIWAIAYASLVLVLARPWCSLAATLAMITILIFVSNAKQKSLREPFLFQDYDYFLDTLRFPRLFLPFLGIKGFCACAAAVALAIAGFLLEKPPAPRLALNGQSGAALIILALGITAMLIATRYAPKATFRPGEDLRHLGFTAFLWLYGLKGWKLPTATSPFATLVLKFESTRPHLLALQSESFFDPRGILKNIRQEILANFDALRAESFLSGQLAVPAWGANTVRTEFAFLTGIPASQLEAARFNPYQAMLRGWLPSALPAILREAGYQTICVHPYYSAFYGRKKIFPGIGFEIFMDLEFFNNAPLSGQYVGDLALGERLAAIFAHADKPTFVFAISMENHGPLHLEKPIAAADEGSLYTAPPPPDCDNLGVYLNHLRHTDQMLGRLKEISPAKRPLSICFYGDHVPIMPECYRALGAPTGDVPYFCWNSHPGKQVRKNLRAEDLALSWLKGLRLIQPQNESIRANQASATRS